MIHIYYSGIKNGEAATALLLLGGDRRTTAEQVRMSLLNARMGGNGTGDLASLGSVPPTRMAAEKTPENPPELPFHLTMPGAFAAITPLTERYAIVVVTQLVTLYPL